MNIWMWFVTGVYAAGAVYTFREVGGRVAHVYHHYPDGDEVAMGLLAGTISAIFWPLVLPPVLLHYSNGWRPVRFFLVERVLKHHGKTRNELVESRPGTDW